MLFIIGWDHWKHWNKRCSPTNSGDPCQGWKILEYFSFFLFHSKIEKLLADVGTNKSNILEARIWLKDIKRDFAAMNGVLFICDGISQMTPIFFCESKRAYYCKHRSGTRGWTRRARECATASRATLPERTCWSRSRLLPQFELKYIFPITLKITSQVKIPERTCWSRYRLLQQSKHFRWNT